MRQLPENFFGWNDHKSIMLTKFATLAAAMGCVVMVLCGPRIVSWVLAVHALQLVHPELYVVQSAPWYTSILIYGVLTIILLLICIVIKVIINHKSKQK